MTYSSIVDFFDKNKENPVYTLIKNDIDCYSNEELELFLSIMNFNN